MMSPAPVAELAAHHGDLLSHDPEFADVRNAS